MAQILRPPQRRLLPGGFGQKVKIDWSHPLANGLTGCYLPGISGGINLVGIGGDLTFDATALVTTSPEGPCAVTPSTGGLRGTAPAAFYNTPYLSFYLRCHATANSANNASIIMIGDSNNWSSPYSFVGVRADAGGGSTNGLNFQYSGGNAYQQSNGGAWTVGKTQSVGATYDMSVTTNVCQPYVNGLAVTGPFGTGTKQTPAATAEICIGTGSLNGGDRFALNANSYLACFWNRKLSAAEHAALDADPYCFLISTDEAELPQLWLDQRVAGLGAGFAKRTVLSAFDRRLNLGNKTVPTGKLRIDWSHPLTKGLMGCWVPGVMGGRDLTGNLKDLLNSVDGTPIDNRFGEAIEGPAYGTKSASFNTQYPNLSTTTVPPRYKNWSTISLYYRGDRNAGGINPGSVPYFVYLAPDVGLTPPYTVVGIGESGGTNYTTCCAQWNRASTNDSTATVDFNQAGTLSCLGTFNPSGNVNFYKNGAVVATKAWGAGAPAYGTTPTFWINGWEGRTASTLCYIACVWDRELTAAEALALDADPYCFLLPQEAELPAIMSTFVDTRVAGAPVPARPQRCNVFGLPKYPPGRIQRGLTAWWPLDSSTCEFGSGQIRPLDIIGNNYGVDAKSKGAFGGPSGLPADNAYYNFDATTNSYLVLNSDPLQGGINAGSNGTYAAWVYLRSYVANGGFTPRIFQRTDQFQLIVDDGGQGAGVAGTVWSETPWNGGGIHTTGSVLPLNTWVHVVATISAGVNTAIYINGAAASTAAGGVGLSTSSVHGLFCRDNAARIGDGKMADAMVFNGTVLNANEIADLYKSYFVPVEELPALYLPTVGGAKTLTASPGSYALTGSAVTLRHSWMIAAAPGSYALTGQPVTLRHNYVLTATTPASYALTGQDATLTKLVLKILNAAPGSYALTGASTTILREGRVVAAAPGAYGLVGASTTVLRWGHKLAATTPASYALTGQPATLRHNYVLTATTPASYALTGFPVNLLKAGQKAIVALPGTYALTGVDVTLRHNYKLSAVTPASYALTGQPAGLKRGKNAVALPGSYALTGQPATLRWAHRIAAAPASYALTGQDAILLRSGTSTLIASLFTDPDTFFPATITLYPPELFDGCIMTVLPEDRAMSARFEDRALVVAEEDRRMETGRCC